MARTSGIRTKHSRCESETSRSPDDDSGTPTDIIHAPGVSDSCLRREQGNKETPGPEDQLPHRFPSSGSTENEEIVITTIRATDVVLGLKRLPAGFYTEVHYGNLEWRTESKPSSVNDDVVEWSGPIPTPVDLAANVRFSVYASFEFQHMLGSGEPLRELIITVKQLLDHSERNAAFSFLPMDGDVVSPCSSIMVAVRLQKRDNTYLSTSRVLGPHSSTSESRELEDATNEGHSALSRYRKHGGKRNLERSIQQFEHALNICPVDHPCRAAAQCNLAFARLILCRVEDWDPDISLEVPLRLYRNALASRPVGHLDRPSTLIHLATLHLAQLQKRGDNADKAQAETLLHEAMELSSTQSHENRIASFLLQLQAGCRVGDVQSNRELTVNLDSPSHLTEEELRALSVGLVHRFERFGDVTDLQQAITILQRLVKRISILDDRYCGGIANLGVALFHRFNRLGELSDLEGAISKFTDAVDLTPLGHRDKPGYLNNLGNTLYTRFQRLGDPSDLEDAISTLRDAADFTPHDHPDKSSRLNNLGTSLRTRFEHVGQLSDLEDAISMQRDAVYLTPHGHPMKPGHLHNLGNSLRIRFERLGRVGDLEDAISTLEGAVDLTPLGHPDRPGYLNSLGISFKTRFEYFGWLSDLEDAISRQRDAVNLTPHGHPDMPGRLNNLGNVLRTRFQRLGQLRDLEDAISRHRDAIDVTPHDHLDIAIYLNELGASFFSRFQRLGELRDLEDAISRQRDAVDLVPLGHPDKPSYLGSLGNSFLARFERLGELSDLEDVISMLRDVVDLTPLGHPAKPSYLNNLGNSFYIRFRRLGDPNDLEDAISRLKNAVDLTSNGHPDQPGRLNNLGNSLRTRFQHFGQLCDLEEAMSMLKDVVDLVPFDHPDKPGYLSNLATTSLTRFRHLGTLNDLEDAISRQKDAVDLTPYDHADKPRHLYNLGNSFFARFQHRGHPSDLEDAISIHRDAVALTPHGHPEKSTYLSALGDSILSRSFGVGELSNFEQPIVIYSHASSSPIGPINDRFFAAQKWIFCARRIHHHSLLHAYSVALNLLPELAWIGLSLEKRYSQLTRGADIVREAAAAALDSGLTETAVEWLEQGRSIVWGELFQLRSSYEELSSVHPDQASRLRQLSAALDHASATHEKSLSVLSEQIQDAGCHAIESPQQVADRHRSLAIERDKLLEEIRRLPGFGQFLRRKPFSQLRASARSGPVVILNIAESRCDALIVLAGMVNVIHVPLPHFTSKRSADLRNILQHFVRRAREGATVPWNDVTWDSVLPPLWKSVVKPVLDALAFSAPGSLSRIFWCPTGPLTFLPIHAAGLYENQYSEPGHKVFDFVVSSYVPTLAILAPPPRPVSVPGRNLHLLAVRQPHTDGLSRLPGVTVELEYLKDVIRSHPSARTILVESSVGTVEEVLSLMKEADWVHFACHGIQDDLDSGLCLADRRRLRLRDIVALSRPRGGLAFLSACQTATGEKRLSDEAIHMAAGMLFAGYGGVVGTMWSISDKLAPVVARDIYTQLFQNGARPDYREAARALHDAIGGLRDRDVSFEEWIPFIHVGL